MAVPVLLLGAIVALTACSAAPPIEADPTATTPSTSPTPTAATGVSLPTGVIGSAALAEFTMTVVHLESGYALNGFAGADGLMLGLTVGDVAADGCLDGDYVSTFGLPVPDDVEFITEDEYGGDPTFLTTAVLLDVSTPKDGCWYEVAVAAPIIWTVPPAFSSLAVADSGERGGALGIVTVANAVPVSYVVRRGDVFAEVAARFGVTSEQLLWLNPRRTHIDATAYTDEVLNLDSLRR